MDSPDVVGYEVVRAESGIRLLPGKVVPQAGECMSGLPMVPRSAFQHLLRDVANQGLVSPQNFHQSTNDDDLIASKERIALCILGQECNQRRNNEDIWVIVKEGCVVFNAF